MKLILVHGRAQQDKDPSVLQAQWEQALRKGLDAASLERPARMQIAFPYYGDELDELVQQLESPSLAEVNARGTEPETADAAFRREFLEELAKGANLTDAEIELQYPGTGEIRERGVMNWEWVQAIARALDHSRRLGNFTLDLFTRDVSVYLTVPAVRRRIDDIVAATIGGEPCVVVGHSLGSVVAYNVLRSTNHKVRRYVTVGSPLGVKAIQRRLDLPLCMPSTTCDWFNAMDEADVVSLRPLDAESFPIRPEVTNRTSVQNDTDNRHGIAGYLSDAKVARWIVEALTS